MKSFPAVVCLHNKIDFLSSSFLVSKYTNSRPIYETSLPSLLLIRLSLMYICYLPTGRSV